VSEKHGEDQFDDEPVREVRLGDSSARHVRGGDPGHVAAALQPEGPAKQGGRQSSRYRGDDEFDATVEETGASFTSQREPEAPKLLTYIVVISFTIIGLIVVGGGLFGRFPLEAVLAVIGVYSLVIPVVTYYYYRHGGRL
jgi:hypothetical protein